MRSTRLSRIKGNAVEHLYHWQGEVEDFSEALAEVKTTRTYAGAGGDYEVSSRRDYESRLRECGVLGQDTDLRQVPELVAVTQAHWHCSGANACTFAAYLSERRPEYGWETYVVMDAADNRGLVSTISSLTQQRLPVPEVEVISVILPELTEEAELVALLTRLSGFADWDVKEIGSEDDPDLGDLVRLGLRAAVEFDHWAEVLGFGQFAAQPATRLAPFTELAIRAKPPERPRRTQRAYMADINIDGLDQVEFGTWWHDTKEERRRRLSTSQDLRGKAKATFSVRKSEWID